MELRRLLFDRALTQADVVRRARELGFPLDRADLSRIVSGKRTAQPRQREALRAVLRDLDYPKRIVDSIKELR
jgi:hypothetical protein